MNNTDKHLNLVADLAMNTILPKQTKSIEITLYDGRRISCQSFHMDYTDIVANCNLWVQKIPMTRVKSIQHIHKVQYPELPAWYKIPERSNAFGWTMANLRAVLNRIMHSSNTLPMVLSTRFNFGFSDEKDSALKGKKCLILSMSAAWSGLPVYIRHFFLDELYRQYVVMNQFYGVPDDYNQIRMYSYKNPITPIAVRTPTMTRVTGGPFVYHNQ